MMIPRLDFVDALGVKPKGPAVKAFTEGKPCLEPVPTLDAYVIHRHRRGARKVRRVLRRYRQRREAWGGVKAIIVPRGFDILPESIACGLSIFEYVPNVPAPYVVEVS